MPGQRAVDYSYLIKALPLCTKAQYTIISRLIEVGDIKQTAKDLGKSENWVGVAINKVRAKLNGTQPKRKQRTEAQRLLMNAGINPKWLAQKKRELITQDKPAMAALKAINDCEEVFGLKEVASGIHIDTGPKLIINLGSGFDGLKQGAKQIEQEMDKDGQCPNNQAALSPVPARESIDTQVAESSSDSLKSNPSAIPDSE